MPVTIALDDRATALLAAYAADPGHDVDPSGPDPALLGEAVRDTVVPVLIDAAGETTHGSPAYPRLAEADVRALERLCRP